MKILAWSIGALVFGIVGLQSVGAMIIALVCMCCGVYELQKRDSHASSEIRHEKRFAVWVNGSIVNSGLTEEEADVMADAYLNAGFFDVETGEQ